jgi:hypothetical protein
MRKKIQTRGEVNGSTTVTQLGWVAEDRLEADVQQEKEHFSRLAMRDDLLVPIKAVEATDELLVVFYATGASYLMIQWVTE